MSIGEVIYISIGCLLTGIEIGMGIQIIYMHRHGMIKNWAYPKPMKILKKLFNKGTV